ncbi:hypothetical protein [Paenibacillus taichungensis]|uniref:hypothetical protein n=1 Tax=Paenibacillus taichungensis TaxID=484184 RepID=UPI0038D0DD5E
MTISNLLKERVKELIDIIYAGTSNAMSVADQLTFFWSILLLAKDSPKKLSYPFKLKFSYTWEELRNAGEASFEIIHMKVLPEMKQGRSYLPKRMAKAGEKLTITPYQCSKIIECMSLIYDFIAPLKDQFLDCLLYDYMLNILLQESIEGEDEWDSEGFINFLNSLSLFHTRNIEERMSILDVNCRAGQLLTTNADSNKTLRLCGLSQSQIMVRISTFRLLLVGAKKFSVRYKKDISINRVNDFSVNSPFSKPNEKFNIVFVNPPKGKQQVFSWRTGSIDSKEEDLKYLLYALSNSQEKGWIFVILPDELLDHVDIELWDRVLEEVQIISAIKLPKDLKSNRGKDEKVLLVIRNEKPTKQQKLKNVNKVYLKGYDKIDVSQFWDDYQLRTQYRATSDLNATIEVSNPYNLYEPLLQSISNLENTLRDSKDIRSQKVKLNEWRSNLSYLGEVSEILLTLQKHIKDNKIETTISEEGEVIFNINHREEALTYYKPSRFKEILSSNQWDLFGVFCDSNMPLAIHTARQALSKEVKDKFTIQHAVDTVHTLGRLGLLERIDVSVNGNLKQEQDTIDLWMKVTKGERLWKSTVLP